MSPRCPRTQGWEERTWGSFEKTEMGVTEKGGGREPMSWPYLEKRNNGWRDCGLKHCSNGAVLFSFFSPRVMFFGSLEGSILQFRHDLTCPGLGHCLLVLGNQGTILRPHILPWGLSELVTGPC